MKLICEKRGARVEWGGEEPSGWLPSGAAKPLPTPAVEHTFDLGIYSEGDGEHAGYLLIWSGTGNGDTWHSTLAEAQRAGEKIFGVPRDEWVVRER